jgi:demethylmenaquinone methyltransferase/2-methoxy-6-polyprenyl-1,4-benzoquinol methylase
MAGGATRVVDDAMRAYYDARAHEHDDWWDAGGRFGDLDRPGWDDELGAVAGLLSRLEPARTLDVACSTGFFTRHLRGDVVALDQSRPMLDVAAARLPGARIVRGEAVPLPFADDAFERVVTTNFYGHLLAGERAAFLAEARRVAPELVVVDAALHAGVAPEEHQERATDDGRRHVVYKRCFSGEGLAAELGRGEVLLDGAWFVAVRARR